MYRGRGYGSIEAFAIARGQAARLTNAFEILETHGLGTALMYAFESEPIAAG